MSSPFYIGRSGGIALEGAISSAMFVTPSHSASALIPFSFVTKIPLWSSA
jgi:hypothetical protein